MTQHLLFSTRVLTIGVLMVGFNPLRVPVQALPFKRQAQRHSIQYLSSVPPVPPDRGAPKDRQGAATR
jgi:hypothetical protein